MTCHYVCIYDIDDHPLFNVHSLNIKVTSKWYLFFTKGNKYQENYK